MDPELSAWRIIMNMKSKKDPLPKVLERISQVLNSDADVSVKEAIFDAFSELELITFEGRNFLNEVLTSNENEIVRTRAAITLLDYHSEDGFKLVLQYLPDEEHVFFFKRLLLDISRKNWPYGEELKNAILKKVGAIYKVVPEEAGFFIDYKYLVYESFKENEKIINDFYRDETEETRLNQLSKISKELSHITKVI
jgi:hypothetical protein